MRAVANSTSATFLRVVGSELIQKYLGDGPKLVRELFRVADDLSPSIVFIDEIDAVGIIWPTNKLALPFAVPVQDHTWLIDIPNSDYNNQLETGDEVDIFVSLGLETVVKKCGILLMCWKGEDDS
ncbi:ATPase, AAA-type, core [Dillenia turbinata]|uniref:ATPase, AAA-type, core n=1 Tax=Dillenia turbinata TaxID=194707 RepID=A0AAN8UIG8_9MAGN